MLTIVVSTIDKDENFNSMLLKSVGLKDVELLIYENKGKYSLTEIYNKGLKESKYDIVVYLHSDIIMGTPKWGQVLLNHYEKSDYAILGVAGSRQLTNGQWWVDRNKTYGAVKHTDGKKVWMSEFSRPLGNDIQQICAMDGVFFSCHKQRIKCGFDESYKGFHFYDISFSFQNHLLGAKVGIHTNIMLTHKSVGQTNEVWEQNRQQFVEQYKNNLPTTIDLDVTYIEPKIKLKNEEKLAIIIPTKNKVDELLIPCIYSIVDLTTYSNYQIYIADTGSNEEEKQKIFELIKDINKDREIIKLIEYDYYNFAKINNDVVKTKISGDVELLLFVNNDVELVNDAITILVDTYQKNKKDVGTIGSRLHFADGSIQHLGMILQENKKKEVSITHKFLGYDFKNTMPGNPVIQTHGNTAAFMMVSKQLFDEIGGFNENYLECFEDVEFNLSCYLKNKRNLTNSNSVCYHFESQTRGRKIEQEDVNLIFGFIDRNKKIKNTFYQTNQ